MEPFAPYGKTHFAMLLLCAAGWLLAIRAARRRRDTPRERGFRLALGLFILLLNTAWLACKVTPGRFELATSLPLHLCDAAWMAAVWSLLSGGDPRRLRHQLVYYWGLGLSPLGLLTPDLEASPAAISFWAFWLRHWQIVGAALVNLAAFRVRPSWRGFFGACAVTAALVAPVTLFNAVFATPYFYTGPSVPENPTPLDLLGRWPLRIVWIVLLTALLFFLMTLPAALRRKPGA
ncbi:MAG: TIGR02206 family membrane protein [Planctomycetes bacterium]|nr:TIGR02206 family membrane protein [Planctomycetota bacterium]